MASDTGLSLGWVALAQSGLALILVCAAAVVLIRLWGRWRRQRSDAGAARLERVASLPLGSGAAVHLVRTGTRLLLLGVTQGGVSLLGEEAAPGLGSAAEPAPAAHATENGTPVAPGEPDGGLDG